MTSTTVDLDRYDNYTYEKEKEEHFKQLKNCFVCAAVPFCVMIVFYTVGYYH